MSFRVANDFEESPRLTLLADHLRSVEGDFDDVPVDHVPDNLQSTRSVHVSVKEYRVEIDVTLVLAVESVADRVEEDLVGDWKEAIGIRLVDGASRRIIFRTRENFRL